MALFTPKRPVCPSIAHLARFPAGDALLLLALALAMRLPFQTTMLYHWDSVLYARALAHFDVSESQPHPPGYLLYVGTARAVQLVLGDANRSLVAVSLLASLMAVGLLYLLALRMFSRWVAVAAALLLATAPTFWFYSGVAYPYTALAAASIGLVGLAVAYARGAWSHPWWLGLLAGLLGGLRLDAVVFLAPLLGVEHLAHWRRTRQWRDLIAPVPAALLGVALWLLPTAALSQGWDVYWPLLRQQGSYIESSYSVWARGWEAVRSNGWQVLVYAWEGLGLAVVPLVYALGRAALTGRRTGWRLTPGVVLALWLAPPVLFYTLVHIGDRGYSLSYLPALCIVAALGMRWLLQDVARLRVGRERLRRWLAAPGRTRGLAALLLLGCVSANVANFLLGRGRISAYEIGCLNQAMPRAFELIREHFEPAQTLVFTSFFYQHVRYYLPAYYAWWYDPLTRPVFRERLPPEIQNVVLYSEALRPARQPNLSFYPLPCGRRLYYFFGIEPGAQLVLRPPTVSVRSAP